MIKNEIIELIDNFLQENPEGIITLCQNKPIWENNKYGISFTKGSYTNPNKIQWEEYGVLIRETLGYSLITGKHVYIPYEHITSILLEDTTG